MRRTTCHLSCNMHPRRARTSTYCVQPVLVACCVLRVTPCSKDLKGSNVPVGSPQHRWAKVNALCTSRAAQLFVADTTADRAWQFTVQRTVPRGSSPCSAPCHVAEHVQRTVPRGRARATHRATWQSTCTAAALDFVRWRTLRLWSNGALGSRLIMRLLAPHSHVALHDVAALLVHSSVRGEPESHGTA
jgi:hypothetical protein